MGTKRVWKREDSSAPYEYRKLLYARVDDETHAKLRAVAEARGVSVGNLIDEMTKHYIKPVETKEAV
jgi:predicted HicB family RNase H-like nuclease